MGEDEVDGQEFHAVCSDARLEGKAKRGSYGRDVTHSPSSKAGVPKFAVALFHGLENKRRGKAEPVSRGKKYKCQQLFRRVCVCVCSHSCRGHTHAHKEYSISTPL